MFFAAAGYPPIKAESKIPPQFFGILRKEVRGRKIISKKTAALLLQIKTERAINGKTAGITEKEQRNIPLRIPSLKSRLSKIKRTDIATAASAVRKFCFVKMHQPFSATFEQFAP